MAYINSWTDLNNLPVATEGRYCLTKDLLTTDADYAGIGNVWKAKRFNGTLFGNGHIIDGLIITQVLNYVGWHFYGLFAGYGGFNCYDLGLTNLTMDFPTGDGGNTYVGGLAGYIWAGEIARCYVTGLLHNNGMAVGGLIGRVDGGCVHDCYTNLDLAGEANCGGLIGYIQSAQLLNSYAIGDVTENTIYSWRYIGGAVGRIGGNALVENIYSTGSVNYIFNTTNLYRGGFVGGMETEYSTVANCGWFNDGSVDNAIGIDYTLDPDGPVELIDYNIKVGGGTGYIDDDVDWFYDKTRGLYVSQAPAWDFDSTWLEGASYPTLDYKNRHQVIRLNKRCS